MKTKHHFVAPNTFNVFNIHTHTDFPVHEVMMMAVVVATTTTTTGVKRENVSIYVRTHAAVTMSQIDRMNE